LGPAHIPRVRSAVRLHAPGGLTGLRYEQIETPQPARGEALVRVHAAAVTRGELEWPVDRLPAIPSYELSGVVADIGSDTGDLGIGDHVYALSGFERDGAAADFAIVPAERLAPKPSTLGHVESAAIPLAGLSAWQGLFDHGELRSGQRVLIHGAAGGVGSFAVQLAAWRGAHVTGTASTENIDFARDLGAATVVDHVETRFEDVVEPVDLVFDTVGGDRLERSLAVLRPGGTLVSVAEEPPAEQAAERGLRALYFVVEPNREELVQLGRLADSGSLRPTIDQVFPLADARAAFERSLSGSRRGKIVLRVADEG
jgi:NADPH:quinone reductase-like Zn-dependent oxidoreductase